jgi:hypothetical protein
LNALFEIEKGLHMAVSSKNERSPVDAKADISAAITGGATKLTLERKDNGNWDLEIAMPDPAAPGV